MTVKMIIERIIKALLKSKILQFRTNLQTLLSGVQDHQFEYVFTDEPKTFFQLDQSDLWF